MFDLSRVVPEAKSIVQAAATVYLHHTRQWFVGLLVHGSALKSGFIAGCSDIDLQLYLDASAFNVQGSLPFELCISIHRDLSKISPVPFRYIQCYVWLDSLPEDQVGPIPGAYHLVAGELPVAEATDQQLRDSARKALAEFDPEPVSTLHGLLSHGGGRLEMQVRWLCTDVWPKLYQVLTLQYDDAPRIWGLPKQQAIALLPQDTPLGRAIRAFYQAVQTYYPAEASVEQALAVIETGVVFLRTAKAWWIDTNSLWQPAGSVL
jgi:hypothetical protein